MSLNGYQFFIINQIPDCRRHMLATLLLATRGPSLGHLSDLCQICVRYVSDQSSQQVSTKSGSLRMRLGRA